MCERPFAAFNLDALRQTEFQQVADGRRDDVFIALVKFFALVRSDAAERFGNVRSDGRFFGDDQCFAHENVRDYYAQWVGRCNLF